MISHLMTSNVGCLTDMELNFGSRLNLITGDNCLDKSFILDIIFLSITGKFPVELNGRLTTGKISLPMDRKISASIKACFDDNSASREQKICFDKRVQNWIVKHSGCERHGLLFI